jgi:hypothetical protein
MRSRLHNRLLATVLGIIAASFLVASAWAQQPVVVELFTSEGCSSCPPADALLGTLSQHRILGNADVILLGEHVDYWDGQGWRDRFSSPEFTQRQNGYVRQLHLATAYTPQIVIDGHLQGSGGNGGNVQRLIEESAHSAKSATVTLNLVSPEKLQVMVTDSSGAKLQVLFAVTEDNLTTSVRGGENGGRVLKHAAVVHELRSLGNTSNGKFEKTISLPDKSDWKKEDLRAVVLVQNASSGQILGAADILYAGAHPTAATGR